jgi:hypothetical protein
MYGQQVPNVKETKMLGVVIDSKLNWSPHITQKIASCKKALMMIRPLLSPKPIYTRWLYEGLIIPMLTYGSAVWGHAAQKVTIREKLSSRQRLGLTAMGRLLISRADSSAASARRRTTAYPTVVSRVLCPGYVVNKKLSCVLISKIWTQLQ